MPTTRFVFVLFALGLLMSVCTEEDGSTQEAYSFDAGACCSLRKECGVNLSSCSGQRNSGKRKIR